MGASHCCQNHQIQTISLNPVSTPRTKSQFHIIEPKVAESSLELDVIMQIYEEILDHNNQSSHLMQGSQENRKNDLEFKYNVVNPKYDCMAQSQSNGTNMFTGMRTDLSTNRPECTFYRVPFGGQLSSLRNSKLDGYQRSLTRRVSSSSMSSNRRQLQNEHDQQFKMIRVDSEDIKSKSRSSSSSNYSIRQNMQNNRSQKMQQAQILNQTLATSKNELEGKVAIF